MTNATSLKKYYGLCFAANLLTIVAATLLSYLFPSMANSGEGLAVIFPLLICYFLSLQFFKKEQRYFSKTEQKQMVRAATIISTSLQLLIFLGILLSVHHVYQQFVATNPPKQLVDRMRDNPSIVITMLPFYAYLIISIIVTAFNYGLYRLGFYRARRAYEKGNFAKLLKTNNA